MQASDQMVMGSLEKIEGGIERVMEKQRELADRVLSLEQREQPDGSGRQILEAEALASRARPAEKWINHADGSEVRVLRKRDSLASQVKGEGAGAALVKAGVTIGDIARALAVGPRTELERKAMSEGTPTAGGHLVPTPLAAYVIDRMRAQSVVNIAGAQTVPLESQTLKIARVTADPTLEWLAENAQQTASDPSFDAVVFSAKTLRCLVRASREVVEDAPNFSTAFEEMLARAFAAELDRVVLVGSGSGAQPLGLFGTSGIGTFSMGTNGAAIANFDPFVECQTTLQTANARTPTAFIYAPRTAGQIGKLKATDNQPLQAPADIAAVPKLVTTAIPVNQTQGSASNASCILSGDFSDCLIGVRTNFTLEANQYQFADYYQWAFLAHLRVDVQFARPASFCRVIGLIP